MRFLRSRRAIIIAALLVIGVPTTWLLARPADGAGATLTADVTRGDFVVTVTTAGELRARSFVQIQGPTNAQQAEAYQMKIASIVPEGTVVKVGDIVAELDRSTLAAKMAEVGLALQKAEAQYEQAMLDSTLTLSKAREDMRTMELGVEEKKIAKEQAIYEAPSIQRTAVIDLEKAVRALEQAKKDYKTKTEQSQAKMREVGADLERQRNKLKVVQEVMSGFTIRATSPGMVIYVKEWNGRKKGQGSQINPWDPTVATLPDLTQMESITYVNEIDVRKVAVGQPVTLTLDADPDKRLTGQVVAVANVGEQRPNADAKVFEVKISVAEADTTLRPGMTTGNTIRTTAIKNVLSIPLEAVHTVDDVPYVYKKSGSRITKQEVETGAMNDNAVVVVKGVSEEDQVLLVPPPNAATMEAVRLPGSTRGVKTKGGDSATAGRQIPVTPAPAAPAPPSGAK